MAERREMFTSRWGLVIAALGMAVGTGNVWRFPRILATNEGGEFLIPWIFFLFLPLTIFYAAPPAAALAALPAFLRTFSPAYRIPLPL